MTDNTNQDARTEILRGLIDTYHRERLGDYTETYDQFAAEYLPEAHEDWDGEPITLKPVPRYASMAEDETYGMISLHESLKDALNSQAAIPENGEYLNVPAGIVDMDTGESVATRIFVLSKEQSDKLAELFDDAVQYRRSEDDDEDGENDNKQADAYIDIARTMGVEV